MNDLLTRCPVCDADLAVTRLHCRSCSTTIEGRFAPGALAVLEPEQLDFVETFVRCEGKFTRMEVELGLSYPTIRNRLHDIIRALGYEPGAEIPSGPSEEERRELLSRLESGEISTEEAMEVLRGGDS